MHILNCRDWQLPVYNCYNDNDIVVRLLSSGTALSEAAKYFPRLQSFSDAAASYAPIGVCYLMLSEELVIKQASEAPGGIDWTVGQVRIPDACAAHMPFFEDTGQPFFCARPYEPCS